MQTIMAETFSHKYMRNCRSWVVLSWMKGLRGEWLEGGHLSPMGKQMFSLGAFLAAGSPLWLRHCASENGELWKEAGVSRQRSLGGTKYLEITLTALMPQSCNHACVLASGAWRGEHLEDRCFKDRRISPRSRCIWTCKRKYRLLSRGGIQRRAFGNW